MEDPAEQTEHRETAQIMLASVPSIIAKRRREIVELLEADRGKRARAGEARKSLVSHWQGIIEERMQNAARHAQASLAMANDLTKYEAEHYAADMVALEASVTADNFVQEGDTVFEAAKEAAQAARTVADLKRRKMARQRFDVLREMGHAAQDLEMAAKQIRGAREALA